VKNSLDSTFDRKDPYKTLGVAPGATPAEIRKTYIGLAKRNHQDLFATDPEKYRSSTRLMQDINAAYELLSDPARRQLWDRQHPAVVKPRAAPPAAPPRTQVESRYYDPELVNRVLRKYNEFVGSLRTAAERQKATRKIGKFQTSRAGSAYIRGLVDLQYREVMDFLKLDRRVSVFDDELVAIMFLYEGSFEVSPSGLFITYAYILYRENRGKFPPGLDGGRRPSPGQHADVVQLRLPGSRGDDASSGSKPDKGLGSQVWEWLMAKPGSRRQ